MPHSVTTHETASARAVILPPAVARTRNISAAALTGVRLDAPQQDLARIVRSGRLVALPALGGILKITLPQQTPAHWQDTMVLAGPAGAIQFADGARLVRGLTGIDPRDLPQLEGEHIQWLAAALAGRLAETPFAEFQCLPSDADFNAAGTLALRVQMQTPQHRIDTVARAALATWKSLFARTRWAHQRTPLADLQHLLLPETVSLGRHTLPAAMFRTLGEGDVILPDTSRFGPDGEGVVTLGRKEVRVRYRAPCSLEIIAVEGNVSEETYLEEEQHAGHDGSYGNNAYDGAQGPAEGEAPQEAYGEAQEGYQEEGYPQEGEASYEEGEQGQPEEEQYAQQEEQPAEASADEYAEAPADEHAEAPAEEYAEAYAVESAEEVDAVPVTLHFQLGTVALPLGELRCLSEGAVVMLNGGSPAAIAIVAGGRTVGRGEAVDVDGSLGIRITQWQAQS
jgi:type III secretion protein Q